MRRIAVALAVTLAAVFGVASSALADAPPPTNGGSNLGGGQSGQCTGPMVDRPASCGN